ncbi:DUF488 domain-containing protein [Dyadobacter aurulentus]|uniref:DUF488 domain-containing protein n=1 Tax=Dyadobacter sp. UC 10 TaxID=2605428 RepID=UPI0011F3896D|nr:DUF488 domain-containing protein [Dyadobacter sp. UC 10]KAA0989226.1 DUF488 domain-containing protein [Dyadobacter sp. UC 10]
MTVFIKRIYEPQTAQDGYRVLIDRLWPRGIKKQDARIDEWLKEVAPSTELRKWFNHEPEKWKAFTKRYAEELRASSAYQSLQSLIEQHGRVTLVYAARDEQFNHAAALQRILRTDS